MGRRRSLVLGRREKGKAEPYPPGMNITTEILPEITLFHILPRLPVKSLLRFNCVSKQWRSFLTTPMFGKMQLHHVTNEDDHDHHKLLVFSTTTPYHFRIMECENPKKSFLTARIPFPFQVRRFAPFEVELFRCMSIATSLHGMVCVGLINNNQWNEVEFSDLILWNPSTRDYKTLSKVGSHEECYRINGGPFGLYYSSSEDDYKLLRVTHHPNVYIYSLKSDSWRKVESAKYFRPIPDWISYDRTKPSVFLNEKLYFLEQIYKGNCLYSIIQFDTKTEKLTEIATPFSRSRRNRLSLMVIKGSINIVDQGVGLWRMDGDGDWKNVVSFPRGQHPLHLMRNGKWLMRSECGDVYEVHTKIKKHNRRMLYSIKSTFAYSLESTEIVLEGRCMETIVSPNQYMK